MHNQLKSINLGAWLEALKGVVLEIKSNLGSKTVLDLKNNLGVLSSRLRKEVVPKMASLHMSLVARNILVSL